MPASPSRRPPASLPNITALRQALDYGDPHLARCSAFYDDVRAFRKKFITSDGMLGPSLHDWRDRDHQDGLREMTRAYLDRDGNGLLFWPDDPSAANFNDLQYTHDRQQIENFVRMLFFRMNQQQYRNEKYKNKDRAPSADTAPPRGASTQNPIIIDNSPDINTPSPQGIAVKLEEIYDVPPSPRPTELTILPAFQPATASARKHSAPDTPGSSPSHQAKRPRQQQRKPTTKTGGHSGTKRPPGAAVPKRTSSRRVLRDDAGKEDLIVAVPPSPTAKENASRSNEEQGRRTVRVTAVDRSTVTFRFADVRPNASEHVGDTLEGGQSPPLLPSNPVNSPSDTISRPHHVLQEPAQDSEAGRDPAAHLPTPSTERRSETVEPAKFAAAAGAAPRIDFLYRVVLSRRPVYSYRKWTPSRKLEETTFAEFMDELRLQGGPDVRGLVFTVEGPGLRAVEEIRRGDELGFDSLRRQLKKVIRSQLAGRGGARGGDAPPLIFEMEIEPVRGESAVGEEDVDDEDFVI